MKTRLSLTLALLLLCTGAALAQTPDDLPPARETVCDNETGAAYGLCNAYCEAMDCESDAPSASVTACGKVRDKFQNVTGRDVPCELSCPCTSIPQFANLLATVDICVNTPASVVASPEPTFVTQIAASSPNALQSACGYLSLVPFERIVLPITPEEAAFCVDLIRTAVENNGGSCN